MRQQAKLSADNANGTSVIQMSQKKNGPPL
jgi:hypothetical protein